MPDSPDVLIARAGAHVRAGESDAAAACGLEILRQAPEHFDALHLIGWLCQNRGQLADAYCYLSRAMRLRPADAAVALKLGNVLVALKRFSDAEHVARNILALYPQHIDAANNLGIAQGEQKRDSDAIEAYRMALAWKPDYAPAHFNLGRVLARSGRLTEAEAAFRSALACAPTDTPSERIDDVYAHLLPSLVELDRPEEALTLARPIVSSRQDLPKLAWAYALLLLHVGDYAAGWEAYESRWGVEYQSPSRPNPLVLNLDAIAGKRILVDAEQGHGDIIQFARYAPLLADRGAIVTLSAYDGLKPLLSGLRGIKRVVGEDENEPAHDIATPIGSLPLAFRTTIETVPAEVPYLHAEPHRVAQWREKLGDKTAPRVGLTWHTTTVTPRRTRLNDLRAILACPNISFHALQKVIPSEELGILPALGLRDHRADLTDFAETAALIDNLDLVITIDTAVAHLAGAMGKPVWLMLQHVADWRWLRYRADSPWYPTARLFRQAAPGDWHGLSVEVATALMRLFPSSVSC